MNFNFLFYGLLVQLNLATEQAYLSGCVFNFLHSKAARTESSQLNWLQHLALYHQHCRPGQVSWAVNICYSQPAAMGHNEGTNEWNLHP